MDNPRLNNNARASTSFNLSNPNLNDSEVIELIDESFLQDIIQIDTLKLRQDEEFFEFDNNTGDSWYYPKDLPIRLYQFNITKIALFQNTLVVLPTGLGKTFIAAVVMYNIYRWYPRGKIIFMAPTIPLVAQQIEACYNIMGMSKQDTVELTGKQSKQVRCELWRKKRVFFATPQTVQSDINSNPNFPFKQVRCIVIDEAHKAKGKYAYTDVVQSISNRNRWFRVLALSATPGRNIEDVVEVIRNLNISHVEVRWENSIDVSPYTFKKNIKTELVPLDQNLQDIKNDFVLIIDKYVRKLMQYDVLTGSMGSLNRNSLLIQHKRFRENSMHHQHTSHSDINSYFSITTSLFHALDLLERHGIRSFLTFFEDDTNSTREKYFVSKDRELKMLITNLSKQYKHILVDEEQITLPNGLSLPSENISDYGHPKFSILKKCLLDFFASNSESRAIVFCEYRETVLLVYRMLLNYGPVVRAKFIVGKGSSIGIKAVTEKQQKNVIAKFREGVFNTLIATCVAEEGIDVGEIGLIVCFDTCSRNPTRFVQRMGRTGRQRKGNVVMLVTEGSEHDNLKEILTNKDKTNQKIVRSGEIIKNLYKGSSRLVPPEFDPKCLEVFIKNNLKNTIPIKDSFDTSKKLVTKPKTPINKKSKLKSTGMRDMREYFKVVDLSEHEQSIFESPHAPPQSTSSPIARPADKSPIQPKMKTRNRLVKNLVADKIDTPCLKTHIGFSRFKLTSNYNFQSTFNDDNLDEHFKLLLLKLKAFDMQDDDDDCMVIDPQFEKLKSQIVNLNGVFNFSNYFKNIKTYEDYLCALPKFIEHFKLAFKNFNYFNTSIEDNTGSLRFKLFSKQMKNLLNKSDINNSIILLTRELDYLHKSILRKRTPSPIATTSRTVLANEYNLVDEVLTLNYFKLNSYDEIFEPDSPENNNTKQPRRLIFDTEPQSFDDDGDDQKLKDLLNSPIEENQKYDVEKLEMMEQISKRNERSPPRTSLVTKKFDIGDADNLFCSEDEDLFADYTSEDSMMQAENNNKEKTQDYDFANFEQSANLFNTTLSKSKEIIFSSSKRQTSPNLGNSQADILTQLDSELDLQADILTKLNPELGSQADIVTQLTPELETNKENYLLVDTQINPADSVRSNSFQLKPRFSYTLMNQKTQINSACADRSNFHEEQMQLLRKSIENLTNQETQIDPADDVRSNIFQLQTQKLPENLMSQESQIQVRQNTFQIQTQQLSQDLLHSQINPTYFVQPNILRVSNISDSEDLMNQETQIDPDDVRPYIFETQTQQFPKLSTNNISQKFTTHNNNSSIIEFSQMPVSNMRNRKRIIDSSDDSDKSIPEIDRLLKVQPVLKPRKRLKRSEFIDDEAVCIDDTENDHETCTQNQSEFINSFVDYDSTQHEPDTSVDMQQVYLKSVKSPGRNGKFIIRQPLINNYINIFSQMPEQDDDYCELNNSFVVDDSDAALVNSNGSSQSNEESLLERAERILKEKRRKKQKKKGKIRLLPKDDSDSDESSDSIIVIP